MITIAGAGVAGLASAFELAKRGRAVTVFEVASEIGAAACSRFAGGMLAPWCEGESADAVVTNLGASAINWWSQTTHVTRAGTLVVAPARDKGEITRFARRTDAHRAVDNAKIGQLEPNLAGRFAIGLYFPQEAHLDPRMALRDLARRVVKMGVDIQLGTSAPKNVDLNCTGMAAALPDLRPVRGEMAILHAPDIQITRTMRLLHPRNPLYLVPRGDDHYMIGATMIESSAQRQISVRSMTELLGAAYALHPAFGEAAIVETGAGLRPAYPDNLPRLTMHDGTLHLNGLYRHGFLLAPAMAAKAADILTSETSYEHHRQCQSA